jgi:hypothetical protein
MSTIIAGHFQLQDEVERARQALVDLGFNEERISGFYLNPPGQHDLTPIGGDEIISAGAKETPAGVVEGAAVGGAVGLAVGAVTSPFTGLVGPILGSLVGAHVGGTLFSFRKMKEAGEPEEGGRTPVEERIAGMLVAVAFDDPADESRAVDLLAHLGAHQIERAKGNIVDGDWADFDPNSLPDMIK